MTRVRTVSGAADPSRYLHSACSFLRLFTLSRGCEGNGARHWYQNPLREHSVCIGLVLPVPVSALEQGGNSNESEATILSRVVISSLFEITGFDSRGRKKSATESSRRE